LKDKLYKEIDSRDFNCEI